jgi:hypothetical protein
MTTKIVIWTFFPVSQICFYEDNALNKMIDEVISIYGYTNSL